MKVTRFADICCGIGGMRIALESAVKKISILSECAFSCDVNKFARQTYCANFGKHPNGDLIETDIDSIPAHDVLLAGFPCQPYSCAGKKRGLFDERAGVFESIVNILRIKSPLMFLLENVPGLITANQGAAFDYILNSLKESNYETTYKIVNSLYYIPQNRKRLYIAGIHKSISGYKQIAGDIFNKIPGNRVAVGFGKSFYKRESEFHLKKYENYCYTLTASMVNSGSVPIINEKGMYRKLTPYECAVNFMGFPKYFSFPVSMSQAYKQVGNSVVVPVVCDILTSLLKQIK